MRDTPDDSTSGIPDDLIPLAEAAATGPRPARGRKRHRSTILRWIRAGRLRGWRISGYWYVSASELRDLLRPVLVEVLLDGAAAVRLRAEETDAILRRAGIRG